MPSFDLGDIRRTIPGAAFARAERYVRQGRVRGVGPGEEAGSLIGHVQGTERQPYEQQIRIIGEGRDRRIIGWCSCPVGSNCKHVGAVLLTALDQLPAGPRDGATVAGMDPDLLTWLDEIEAASAPEPSNDYPPEIRQRLIYVLDLGKPWQTPPRLSLSPYSVRLLKDGSFGARPSTYSASNAFNQPAAKFLRPIDLAILQELTRQRSFNHGIGGDYRLENEVGVRLLGQILETGRCRLESLDGPVLREGEPRQASRDGKRRWTGGSGRSSNSTGCR